MKDLSECRILIVDDVQANVDVLVAALRDDYKLSIALDGQGALRSVKKAPPDLVLLDVMMPGMDGYEVCRRLRSDPETHELPVMFLTALDEVQSKMTAFEAGGTDYVTKPFEVLEVKARVRSLLKARAYGEAAKEILARELKVAGEIQRGMVTSDFSAWSGDPVEVYARLEPAKEIGGDLYTVFPLDEDRLCLVIGDVSGKGVPAALFMAITTTLVRSIARQFAAPEEIVARVGAELCRDNRSNMFVTLLCAVLDIRRGVLSCATGGHLSPVIVGAGGEPRFAFEKVGTIIGVVPDVAIHTADIRLEPRDLVVACTDGVTEAMDAAEEQFGDQRLLSHLRGGPAATARETVDGLVEAVRGFAGGAPQSDDIAVLALRYRPG